jgi:hypothetical protein
MSIGHGQNRQGFTIRAKTAYPLEQATNRRPPRESSQ